MTKVAAVLCCALAGEFSETGGNGAGLTGAAN
jgi:hypothetical protein